MKKKAFGLLALGSIMLTACSSSSAGLSFDEGYQTFHYKGKDYAFLATHGSCRRLVISKEQKLSVYGISYCQRSMHWCINFYQYP